MGRFHPELFFVECAAQTQIGATISGGTAYDTEIVTALRTQKITGMDAAYNAAVNPISAQYPATERDSWGKQEAEARAYAASNTAITPLLSAIATARGLTVADLAARVIAKADDYSTFAGALIGRRQARMDAIAAATTADEIDAVTW